MSKMSFALAFLFAAAFGGGAALSASPAPAVTAAQVFGAVGQAAPASDASAVALACNNVSCHSNEDCGFPDVCGGCRVPSGQFFGHCLPTP
jgi:hypothetical protein